MYLSCFLKHFRLKNLIFFLNYKKNKEANEAFLCLLKIKIAFWYKHKVYMRGGHLSLFLSFSFTESGQNILRMSSVCVCVNVFVCYVLLGKKQE